MNITKVTASSRVIVQVTKGQTRNGDILITKDYVKYMTNHDVSDNKIRRQVSVNGITLKILTRYFLSNILSRPIKLFYIFGG